MAVEYTRDDIGRRYDIVRRYAKTISIKYGGRFNPDDLAQDAAVHMLTTFNFQIRDMDDEGEICEKRLEAQFCAWMYVCVKHTAYRTFKHNIQKKRYAPVVSLDDPENVSVHIAKPPRQEDIFYLTELLAKERACDYLTPAQRDVFEKALYQDKIPEEKRQLLSLARGRMREFEEILNKRLSAARLTGSGSMP